MYSPHPMRGSDKLKGIHELNNGAKSILKKSLVLYNLIVGAVYWHRKRSWVLFVLLSLVEVVATVWLFKLCRPKTVVENGTTKLVDVTPINASGLVSFCWDVLFWGLVGKALMAFSWKWICVYFGIPMSFFFEFIYKPYKKLKGS